MNVEPFVTERAFNVTQRGNVRSFSQMCTTIGTRIDRVSWRTLTRVNRRGVRSLSVQVCGAQHRSPLESRQERGSSHDDEYQSDERAEDSEEQGWRSKSVEWCQPEKSKNGNPNSCEGKPECSRHQSSRRVDRCGGIRRVSHAHSPCRGGVVWRVGMLTVEPASRTNLVHSGCCRLPLLR